MLKALALLRKHGARQITLAGRGVGAILALYAAVLDGDIARVILRGYLHMAVFVFTGLVSGYVSYRLQNKHEEIADKEKEIRQIRLDTDSILENMSSGLIVTDPEGCVLNINPAAEKILGIDRIAGYEGRGAVEPGSASGSGVAILRHDWAGGKGPPQDAPYGR